MPGDARAEAVGGDGAERGSGVAVGVHNKGIDALVTNSDALLVAMPLLIILVGTVIMICPSKEVHVF